MTSTFFKDHLRFSNSPIARDKATIIINDYRITIFTSRLFRIEYNTSRKFENRPTQTFWHRNLMSAFMLDSIGDIHTITTTDCVITLDSSKESLFGLSVVNLNQSTSYHYGSKDLQNLKGTYRTLDSINGAVALEEGLISKRGITVFDDASSVTFEDGQISSVNVDEIDLYVFAYGHDYEQCIKDYYLLSGKTPLIPKYVFGNWWSRYWNYTDEELKEVILHFESRDIPLSVCIIDMDWHITDVPQELRGGWTGYTWNKDYFKHPESFMNWLKEHHLKISMNLHPADGIRPFDDCYEAVCKRMGINPLSKQIIDFDLTNPQFVEAYFKDVHHILEQQGVDFWWIDWQQGTLSKMKNLDPLFALNHYHFYDGLNRGKQQYFIFSRWSKLGSHRYPIGFSGDTFSTWKSLDFQPYFTTTATNVGYGWWSHDIGGHQGGLQDDELYTRWVQLGVFSPVMRLHSTKSFYQRREPWRWNNEVETTVKHFMQLRHKLIPYIHTFNHLHSQGELPLIRPLYYIWPEDKNAYAYKNQYFFGTEFMVRPFTSKTKHKLQLASEKVWFKEGGWFHFFSGEYIKTPGTYTFYGCLRDINLFAKQGSIIPLATNPLEGTSDLPKELDVHVFPGKNNAFTFIEDSDGVQYNTTFTLQSDDTTISLQISSNLNVSIERILHIHLRSVDLDSIVRCSKEFEFTKNSETNSIVLTVPFRMNEDITIKATSTAQIIVNPYSFTKDIMNSIDISNLDTEEKNDIGFINFNNIHESRGWLAKNNTLQEKLDDINRLNIPKNAKDFLYHTTFKAIKNDD